LFHTSTLQHTRATFVTATNRHDFKLNALNKTDKKAYRVVRVTNRSEFVIGLQNRYRPLLPFPDNRAGRGLACMLKLAPPNAEWAFCKQGCLQEKYQCTRAMATLLLIFHRRQ
uniref:MSP domain-containing protein n=1 Tax=Ascaris lumbricoides TaxID=6252 RepID=A0A0M3HZ32_ASCLU